ncbi:MAG: rhomboid family intramembrane serine protease GlpG [Isosphaeraceae bacterium]
MKELALRQSGTLPSTIDPEVLGDYLLTLGVTSRAVQSPEGWAFWVHNEDHVPRAREEFLAFQADPDDPRFHAAKQAAKAARSEAERLDRAYRKNVRGLSGHWDRVNARRRPLTILLITICVAVYLAGELIPGWEFMLRNGLEFCSLSTLLNGKNPYRGLDDIHRGQVWRLFTPMFLHFGILHLLFNMWATLIEGTLIETRRGTKTLLVLVLVSALASNVGQYLYMLAFYPNINQFGGISGVGYALFGYIWMKGRFEPELGMMFDQSTVRTMIIWLLLGFTGLLPMANGAHLVGLIVGVLFGLTRF